MKKLSPIKQLDLTLSYISKNPGVSLNDIFEAMSGMADQRTIVFGIVQKLIKDGYIKRYRSKGNDLQKTYKISFEGQLFLEYGGYVQQSADRDFENDRVVLLEKGGQTNNAAIFLRYLVVFSILAASVYYSLVVWKLIN